MPIVRITAKGQVVIPAEFRRKHGLQTPGRALITERDGQLVITPVASDPVTGSCGILRSKTPLREAQKRHREEEIALEDR